MKTYAPVQSLILILLIAMFSLSLWAQPPTPVDCEILFQTSYGRIIRMLALAGHITPDQLSDLIKEPKPTNPFQRLGKNEGNVTFRRALEREMKTEDAIANWSETRQAFVTLVAEIKQKNESEGDAKISAEPIFNPKLYAQSTHAKFFLTYNKTTNQLIALREGVASRANRSAYFTFAMTTRKTTVGHVEKNPTIFVRKSGEMWTAGVNNKKEIVVRPLNSKTSHVIAPFVVNTNLEFIELPDGRMLLHNASEMSGTFLYDVTDPAHPRELLKEDDDEEKHEHMSAFHISAKGNFYFAAANRQGTRVYRLIDGELKEIGVIQRSREPRAGNWTHPPVLTTDADEVLYVGEAVRGNKGYHVVKFADGVRTVVLSRPDIEVEPNSAVLHWNSKGELILFLSDEYRKKEVYLMNVLDHTVPDINIPVADYLNVKPSWFTLPDGREVIAAIPVLGRPIVFEAHTGTTIWQGPSVATEHNRPLWIKTPDGKTYLVFDTLDGVQVFDVWRGENR